MREGGREGRALGTSRSKQPLFPLLAPTVVNLGGTAAMFDPDRDSAGVVIGLQGLLMLPLAIFICT